MELKFVNKSYFKQLFQNIRPKLQYSKNRIFVTSHFGTLSFLSVSDVDLRSLPDMSSKHPPIKFIENQIKIVLTIDGLLGWKNLLDRLIRFRNHYRNAKLLVSSLH